MNASHLRLTYAIAPPHRTTPPERRAKLAAEQSARIASLPIDALLIYDVQDEAVRNGAPRPFPFQPKCDPLTYAFEDLELGGLPRVVYCAVGQQSESALCSWLGRLRVRGGSAILVGAPSARAQSRVTLPTAFRLCQQQFPELPFGGVVIPERHRTSGDEHERAWAKHEQGCRFFVSQTVWSVSLTRQLLLAVAARAEREHTPAPPLLLTFSPCGSAQTLRFLEWLGVLIPEAIRRELLGAPDMLTRSIELAANAFEELRAFAAQQGLTLGCNIESLTARAAEIDASVELVRRCAKLELGPNRTRSMRSDDCAVAVSTRA